MNRNCFSTEYRCMCSPVALDALIKNRICKEVTCHCCGVSDEARKQSHCSHEAESRSAVQSAVFVFIPCGQIFSFIFCDGSLADRQTPSFID
uniref:TRAF-type domain-containing protein n=1 Tax=Heterorhabditis bacteriophora TaxID=37862 RepID=A0A1I7WVL0_HETBA